MEVCGFSLADSPAARPAPPSSDQVTTKPASGVPVLAGATGALSTVAVKVSVFAEVGSVQLEALVRSVVLSPQVTVTVEPGVACGEV